MARDVRTFVANCDSCRSNKVWRERRQGFLKPLPIPSRAWSEITMDFITELPMSEGCTNMIVVTDRLSKGMVADGLVNIDAESVAKWFLRYYYPHHFLPATIVSDRGPQFTSAFWKRICDQLGIKRLLSTAFSPETDGATERANEVVETVLRELVDWAQSNWMKWLPVGVSAICGRTASSTGVSPFFMTHGWNQELFPGMEDVEVPGGRRRASPVSQADEVIRKLREVRDFAQVSMAAAQESQESAANRKRNQAPVYKKGDKVWLSLENMRTDRPSKKLDRRYAKYEVTEVLGSHNYRLNTPPGPHNVFHTRLLRPASFDPLPGQVLRDYQPPAMLLDGEPVYEVEEILDEKKGRGGGMLYLVRWTGYDRPTWEPYDFVQQLAALESWKQKGRGMGSAGREKETLANLRGQGG